MLLCSGKIYYELRERCEQQGSPPAALVRIEQLYPWAGERLAQVLQAYPNANRIRWVQEEPANMGAWTFVRERIEALLQPNQRLAYVGRKAAASPAVGSRRLHLEEQSKLVDEAFAGLSAGDASDPAR